MILLKTRLKFVTLLKPQLYATLAMPSCDPSVSFLQASFIRTSFRKDKKV